MNEYVFLLRGPRGVARLKVQGTFLVLGRTSSIPLLREDRTISREHAVLVAAPSGIRLKDLGSSNGVQVDGKRLGPYAEVDLDPGSRVSFGSTELVLLTKREATKRLDQAVDEVVVDAEGGTSVIRAQQRPGEEPQAPEPELDELEDSREGLKTLDEDETRDELEDDEPHVEAEPTAPDEWIQEALVPDDELDEAMPLRPPGKVTELDPELTELELPGDLSEVEEVQFDDDPPEEVEEEVSRDALTELAIENVLERGGEETADPIDRGDPEDKERWREVEQELADLDQPREPHLE